MKHIFLLLCLPVCTISIAQNSRATFTLTDTVFQVGSVYSDCSILYQEKSAMRPEDQPCLDSIVQFMTDHPGIVLEIGCHTDQRGSDTANIRISQNHAAYIKNYMVSKGVSEYDLAAVGYGESQLLNSDQRIIQEPDKLKKEELYTQNKRTEFKIIRLPQPVFRFRDSVFYAGAVMFPVILHDFSKCTVRPESFPVIDSIANFLLAHPNIRIEIGYHMDCRGSDASNLKIAQCRVNDVVFLLQQRNVPAAQFTGISYGETTPIVPETYINAVTSFLGKDELHRINRRVEIRIIQITPP